MSELVRHAIARAPLAPLTTLGVGGPAQWLVRARHIGEVAQVHRWSLEQDLPLLTLGGGSNVIIADEGWKGIVLQTGTEGIHLYADGGDTLVRAGAGERWDDLVRHVVGRGLAGLECLSGIPGSVGGTPIQNVGAYGQEVGALIAAVTAWDRDEEAPVTLPGDACGFAYRTSRFKREDADRFIICDVTFRLRPGAATVTYPDVTAYLKDANAATPTLDDVRRAVLAIRRRKGMVLDAADPDTRSVGSFFMNPVVPEPVRERIASTAGAAPPAFGAGAGKVKIPAAWLIQHSGFDRATREGGAGLSSKHPLAIVNRGGATARDVLRLAVRVKRRVMDRFSVSLRPEPVFVGFPPDPDLDYLKE